MLASYNKYLGHNFREETKRHKSLSSLRVKCKCGHSVNFSNRDRIICTHCGNWIYRNDKVEFQYKMKEKMLNK